MTSQHVYRRVIGVDAAARPGTPVDRLSPNVSAKAIVLGQAQSPSVLAAKYGVVDVATLAVKISEGWPPNLTINASGVLQGQTRLSKVLSETTVSVVAP